MNEVSGLQNILMFNSLMFFARRDKISVGFCYCVETANEKDSKGSPGVSLCDVHKDTLPIIKGYTSFHPDTGL